MTRKTQMKKLLYFILFIPTLLFADPFYGEGEKPNKEEKPTKSRQNFTTCPLPEKRNELNLPVEFEDLKLIGIIKKDGNIKSLFIDKNNQIFDFSVNDFLKESLIQFTEITLKNIKYINWALTENCQSPHEITLKI